MPFTPVDDTAVHLMKTLVGDLVQDVESKDDYVTVKFESGAKLIVYDGEFEEEDDV